MSDTTERPTASRATFRYTCLETADHKQFVTEANAMGVRGWELVDIEQAHGFWVGFFKRPVVDDEDDEPIVQNRMPGGVLDLCGGL